MRFGCEPKQVHFGLVQIVHCVLCSAHAVLHHYMATRYAVLHVNVLIVVIVNCGNKRIIINPFHLL